MVVPIVWVRETTIPFLSITVKCVVCPMGAVKDSGKSSQSTNACSLCISAARFSAHFLEVSFAASTNDS